MNLRVFLSHNFTLKLFSVILAFAAWVLAQGEQVHRVTVDVPVRYLFPDGPDGAGFSSRLVVMNDAPLPKQVRLQLSGTRVAISSFVADKGNLEYSVDLREAEAGTRVESFRIPPVELGSDIVLDTVSPADIGIVLDVVDSVTVPVRIRRRGKLREGFREVRSRVNPEEVTLVGSRRDLAQIEIVDTVALRMGELDQTGYLDPLALDLGSLHLLPESPLEVRVSIEVELKLEERQFDNVEIALATGMEAYRLVPQRCRVKVQGPPQLVEELSVRNVSALLSGRPDRLDFSAGDRAPVMALIGEGTEPGVPAVRVKINHPRSAELRLVVEPQSFVVERYSADVVLPSE
jgi:hypothetical protein